MKAIAAVLIFAVVGCGGSFKRSSTAPAQPAVTVPVQSAIVFVGDSIFGRLAIDPVFKNFGFIDAGIFGQRTDQLLAVFPDVLSGKNVCHGFVPPQGQPPDATFPFECSSLPVPPKTVVIFAGWNNFFQNNPGNTALDDLQKMADLAQAQNVKVIICTLYAFDPGHPASWMVPTGSSPVTFYDVWRIPLNDGIKAMRGVTVVDLDAVFSAEILYTTDGVHPTDDGNAQMLNAIIPKI